jgi:hypothetical protein
MEVVVGAVVGAVVSVRAAHAVSKNRHAAMTGYFIIEVYFKQRSKAKP